MNTAQKDFDHAVQRAKRQHWRQTQQKALQLHHNDSWEFWKKIGRVGVGSERPRIPCEVVTGDSISTQPGVVIDTWKKAFQGLLNPESGIPDDQSLPNLNHDAVPIDHGSMEARIATDEVRKQLSTMKFGKAAGVDELPLEVLTNSALCDYMTELFNTCFDSQVIPTMWMRGVINPIPKDNTKDPREPLNSRGITLACVMYKVYCGVLNRRINQWTELHQLLTDEQNGFRQGRSTLDHLSTLTSIVEERKARKLSTFVAFIDFSKAYDCVDRTLMWHKFDKIGMPNKMLNALKCIYDKVECCVRVNGFHSEWFPVNRGLRQGCLLSPLMFNLFINDIAMEINNLGVGVKFGDELLSIMLYADDICLLAESEQDLQRMLDVLSDWCNKWKMSVNISKSQIVHFRNVAKSKTNVIFNIGFNQLDTVTQYKYLGLILSEHLDHKITVKMVAQSASRALGLLIAKFKSCGGMPFEVYSHLYEVLVQSVINYGAAVWGTSSYSCINAVQMKASRFFLGVGRYTPNCAVMGEMGWEFPEQRVSVCVARLWCRLTNLDVNRTNKRVFEWAKQQRGNTWYRRVRALFGENGTEFIDLADVFGVKNVLFRLLLFSLTWKH